MSYFKTYQDAFLSESKHRANTDFNKLCTYGIKPLDDCMLAINTNELIVIAAGSGIGKTELALAISRHNALKGKKVAHYNLEGGFREAIQRMKWRDMIDEYFKTREIHDFLDFEYREWSLNRSPDKRLLDLEAKVYANLKDKLNNNLFFYDNPSGLNCDEFCASLLDFHDLKTAFENPANKSKGTGFNLDLIVIDHLHYFSLDKDENEINEITRILKEAKKITENLNIPVILIAHLRKLPREHGIPDKEDIYGTSNIHKIANTCIIIAPDHENDNHFEGIYPTHMRIAKSRIGLRPNISIYTSFDGHKRSYNESYDLYKIAPTGQPSPDPMCENERPKWYHGREVCPQDKPL